MNFTIQYPEKPRQILEIELEMPFQNRILGLLYIDDFNFETYMYC